MSGARSPRCCASRALLVETNATGIALRSAVYLASGSAVARMLEPLVPECLHCGGFLAVAARVPPPARG